MEGKKKPQKASEEEEGEGSIENPFLRGGLRRSPPNKTAGLADPSDTGGSATTHTNAEGGVGTKKGEAIDGPGLIRAMERKRDKLPQVVAVSEQLDAIIDFTSTRCNISKDLKQSLLKLRKTVQAARKEREELEERLATAERAQEMARLVAAERAREMPSKHTQTETPVFVGGPTPSTTDGRTSKRARQSPGEGAPGASFKKRLVAESPKAKSPKAQNPKTYASVVSGLEGQPEESEHPVQNQDSRPIPAGRKEDVPGVKTGPGRDPERENSNPWVKVRKKKSKGRTKKENAQRNMARKRNRGEALIVKAAEASKYPEVLKALRRDEKLKDLGNDVHCVRRTRTGEMILELKKDTALKGSAYKALAQQVLGDAVEIRALTTEVTLQCKNLDEITEAEEVSTALKVQCGVEVAAAAIRLRKGPFGTQVATIRLPVAEADSALKVAKLKVGWSVCSLSIHQPPKTCFRCLERGHLSRECKGPDRSTLCRRCGGAGHKERECKAPPRCFMCTGKPEHITGGPKCPASKRGRKN